MIDYNKKVLSEANQNVRAIMMGTDVSPLVMVTAHLVRVLVVIAESLDQIAKTVKEDQP